MITENGSPCGGRPGVESSGALRAGFSRLRFQREVHRKPRRSRRPVVHETQKKAGGDLTDLVAIVGVDARSLAVIEHQRGLPIEPTGPLIDLRAHDPHAKEPIDGGALIGVDHLALPRESRAARQSTAAPSSRRQQCAGPWWRGRSFAHPNGCRGSPCQRRLTSAPREAWQWHRSRKGSSVR